MTPAIEHGLEPTAPAPARPPVRLTNGNPLAVLKRCRDVAKRAEWTLTQWDDFRAAFMKGFSPDAREAEHAEAMAVVHQHFTVTTTDTFGSDPAQWLGTLVQDDE